MVSSPKRKKGERAERTIAAELCARGGEEFQGRESFFHPRPAPQKEEEERVLR